MGYSGAGDLFRTPAAEALDACLDQIKNYRAATTVASASTKLQGRLLGQHGRGKHFDTTRASTISVACSQAGDISAFA